MTADPKTVTPKMSVEDAARLMIEHKIGGLPVVEDGKLVGMITDDRRLEGIFARLKPQRRPSRTSNSKSREGY